MNYRHAFHAGNHLDVFKHAALTLVLEWLREKPQPFAVLDTHAGIGVYDLASDAAQRTGEHAAGVGRVFGRDLPAAAEYLRLLADLNPAGLTTYPGSPEIVRRMLRADDRLMACELHPVDVEELKRRYRNDARIAVHHRDGYGAIGALLPPPERRGMVLIDPPFEARDEPERLAQALTAGLRKWPTGTFLAWYPIKDRRAADVLARAAQSLPKTLQAEFSPLPFDGQTLTGGGVMVCNAPWRLDERLRALCEELAPVLGDGHARWSVEWLSPG